MLEHLVSPGAGLARARGRIYQLLSLLYARPPDQDFLRAVAEWVSSVTSAEDISELPDAMRDSLGALNHLLQDGDSLQHLSEAGSVEFTRLFRGVKPYYSPPPPYESVYREESGAVFGETTVEVLGEYRRFGLEVAEGFRGEPPDHLSFELHFMAFLCRQEADCWERGAPEEALALREAQWSFLDEHLSTWVPRLCEEVRGHTTMALFRSFADLTESWLHLDYQEATQGWLGDQEDMTPLEW